MREEERRAGATKEKRKAELDRKRKQCKERISCQPKRRCQSSSFGECLNNLDEGGQESESVGETTSCTFCFESYTTDGSEWVQCVCKIWVHELCIEECGWSKKGKVLSFLYQQNGFVSLFCPFCITYNVLVLVILSILL